MRIRVNLSAGLILALPLVVAGCNQKAEPTEEPGVQNSPTATASPVSIIRPDLEEAKELPLDPLEMSIGFPDGGSELDQDAADTLQSIIESPQYEADGKITLRGHSDSAGSDDANLRASAARAEAVRDRLVELGASEDRFEVIAFGEQNPIEPNANADGSPNEEGRAANRRVDVTVEVPSRPAEPEKDTIDSDDGEAGPEE